MPSENPRPPALLRLPVFALSHLGRAARGAVRTAFARDGLSGRGHFVLVCLSEYGELSQRELADLIAMDRSDLVKLLDTLESSGQLRRAADPRDRRRHVLSITPAGAETMRRGEHLMGRATDDLLHRLTPDERATLHRLILRALDLPDIRATGRPGDL
jgi:DNA-binding MarR family transcriptional regulator